MLVLTPVPTVMLQVVMQCDLASVADDGGVGGDAADGADDGCGLGDAYDESGRVASRPGYPAEPAARSRPFGRVSLAPPFASLIPRFAWPAARCAHRRCRPTRSRQGSTASSRSPPCSSSRRRCAPRSSRCSPRSPWPAAPAAGIASARPGARPASPGASSPSPSAGFAAHRLAHHPAQCSPHSCGRSCGASPALRSAPRRAVVPAPVRALPLRLRQRAAHDCLRLPPHRPPLNRRGGSPPPPSPASIPPSLSLRFVPVSTPCGGVGLTPDASMMQSAQGCPCAASHALIVDPSQLYAPLSCRKQ